MKNMLMRENNRSFLSMISFSEDEGKTWTTPREMPASLCGDRHQHVYTSDGRLFISFRARGLDETDKTWGDWLAWVGTFENLEKGHRIRFKKGGDCAYPTFKRLPDGTLFAATYGRWDKKSPNYILSFRLKMDELDKIYNETIDEQTNGYSGI